MIILTGGKTGGHIMPLIVLAKKLDNVIYIGSNDSLEESLCSKHNIPFKGLPIKNNLLSMITNFNKISINNVKCIISTGGFISVPVLMYGIVHKIPIYLIEGNVLIGNTNKIFRTFSKKVFIAYDTEDNHKKNYLTGLPTMISKNNKYEDSFDVLIIGGSLGSKPLCDLVYSLNEDFKIVLIAGRFLKDYQNIKNVKVLEYHNDLTSLMRQSKVIISRAGAMTTYEIFSINKPCIIIPSKKTKNNHQYINAKYFEKHKLCLYLDEEEAVNLIHNTVSKLLTSEALMVNMMKNQASIVKNNSIDLILGEIDELH